MKKRLKGIALILFGILLSVTSAALTEILPNEYPLIPCVLGLGIGLIGIFAVFADPANGEGEE